MQGVEIRATGFPVTVIHRKPGAATAGPADPAGPVDLGTIVLQRQDSRG